MYAPQQEAGQMMGYTSDELRTVDGFLKEFATVTQKHWRLALDGDPETEQPHSIVFACSYFTSVWLLRAFAKANPQAAAEAVRELCDILDDGGSIGEWNWEILRELGLDPDQIDPGQP